MTMSNKEEPLATPKPAPSLNIPSSNSTVTVRIIDTTTYGHPKAALVFNPEIPGLDAFDFPSYSFLITNNGQDNTSQHILFDIGMRKDWTNTLPPETVDFCEKYMPFTIDRDIDEILDEDQGQLGIKTKDISAVIWSHHHFDHRGNISKFPASTELLWGPGSTKEYTPGYPENPKSSVLSSELKDRNVRELGEQEFSLRVGGFAAHDYFGDGSFYLLSTPGHTVGHISALARVTAGSNPTFVFLGGDCCHYAGIFRPSEFKPLPVEIPAAPGTNFGVAPCPGAWMTRYVHPKNDATVPFLKANTGVNVDQPTAEQSIGSMQEFDASDDVLVCIAHDASLLKCVEFYPATMNDWKAKGWKNTAQHWRFCGDFDVKTAKELKGSK